MTCNTNGADARYIRTGFFLRYLVIDELLSFVKIVVPPYQLFTEAVQYKLLKSGTAHVGLEEDIEQHWLMSHGRYGNLCCIIMDEFVTVNNLVGIHEW